MIENGCSKNKFEDGTYNPSNLQEGDFGGEFIKVSAQLASCKKTLAEREVDIEEQHTAYSEKTIAMESQISILELYVNKMILGESLDGAHTFNYMKIKNDVKDSNSRIHLLRSRYLNKS